MIPPVKCFINDGPISVPPDSISAAAPLPGMADVTYGQCLESVSRFLCRDSHRALKCLLRKGASSPASGQGSKVPRLESASDIELICEKHGALYSVLRLRLRFPEGARSFAVNCAFTPERQAFLRVESRLLARLDSKFGLPYLPRPLLFADAPLDGHSDGPGVMLMIAGWFEDHHEFHLSRDSSGETYIKVWDGSAAGRRLDPAGATEIYEQASAILTSYLDTKSFAQVYPWHHAAGDFVADPGQDPPSVRLITVRGYRRLISAKRSRTGGGMLEALHFFVNLGVRMRIDRLDGTGDPVWAGPECLAGVVRGFARAWGPRARSAGLPTAGEIFSMFLALSPEDRLAFTRFAVEDGRVEADESDFLFPHLPGHVNGLSGLLEGDSGLEGHGED